MDTIRFGWLPEQQTYVLAEMRIEPVEDYDLMIAKVLTSGDVEDDWFHPRYNDDSKRCERFQLPSTHTLSIIDELDGRHRLSTYLVFILGFLKGLRLIPEPWHHVRRVPTKLQRFQDFYVYEPTISRILGRAVEFWRSNNIQIRRAMIGALHWHSLGRTYEHPYEVFNAQYTVLDACWNIHMNLVGKAVSPHARRAEVLAAAYGLHLPEWASVSGKESYLSHLRNDLVHEALWEGEPIGLAHPKEHPSIHINLYHFNSRLLLALLGERNDYTRQPMNPFAMTVLR
jgi:hypothetical protein